MKVQSGGRLPELDGWRGIAAFGVMLYHLHYVGPLFWLWSLVDLFMVLSGFLITRVLLDAQARGGVSMFNFWVRRAQRIWPVYFAAIAFTLLLYALVGRRGEFLGGREYQLLQALTFTQFFELNFVASPSLEWAREFLPGLAHTWSIAIEEQFYLVWPLLLVAALRLGGYRGATLVCAAALVVANAARLNGLNSFVLVSRMDGLALGAGLALLHAQGAASGRELRLRRRVLWCALALGFGIGLRYAISYYPGPPAFDHGPEVVPGFALFFLGVIGLTLEYRGHPALAPLRSRPLLWLGSVSYALYMVHLPVILLLADRYLGGSWARDPAAIALCLGLAYASKRYIEKPLLKFKERFPNERHAAPIRASAEPFAQPAR